MRALPEIFFFAIVFYVLYRFIFNFVVPIARTTRQVRQQFRNMQEMHGQGQGQGEYGPYNGRGQAYGRGPDGQGPYGPGQSGQGPYGQAQGSGPAQGAYGSGRGQAQTSRTGQGQQGKPNSGKAGEYIDFEEIK